MFKVSLQLRTEFKARRELTWQIQEQGEEGIWVGRSVERLLRERGDLRSALQHPCEKPVRGHVSAIPALGRQRQAGPGGLRPGVQ